MVAPCILAAMLADADILFGTHRTWTHSLGATLAFSVIVAASARAADWPVARVTIVCGLAYGSHILLDWLGRDSSVPSGVMAFWPVSHAYFKSGLDVFAEISRRYWKPDEFILGNLRSLSRELAILGPPALLIAWLRARGRRALR